MIEDIKKEFPIFENYPDLIYLDSAATSQKPKIVIDSIIDFYTKKNANVHRGIYHLSELATQEYEDSRSKLAAFIGASNFGKVVFTSGTTASANLLVNSILGKYLEEGDVVVSTIVEHHSNLLPFSKLASENNCEFKLIGVKAEEDYSYDYTELENLLVEKLDRVKVFSVGIVSNVLGGIFDIKRAVELVKHYSPRCKIIVDAAQMVGHMPINVKDLNLDALFFSGHKMFAETGVGVLWMSEELSDSSEPWQLGGGMIAKASEDFTSNIYTEVPEMFEAGTPNISGAVSMAAAARFIEKLGWAEIEKHQSELTKYAIEKLGGIEELRLYGPKDPVKRLPIFSFTLGDIHPHDLAEYLDSKSIAVRAGHHCTQILHERMIDISGSIRASLHVYNSMSDVDRLVEALREALDYFSKIKK